MAFFDMPVEQLESYYPEVSEPGDFEEFWRRTLAENPPRQAVLVEEDSVDYLKAVDVFDVTFSGYADAPIKGWYIRPKGVAHALPTVVSYVGYGGGRGLPEEHLLWAAAGFAQVVVDSRGQGASWGGGGDTADVATIDPAVSGVMTRGIRSPESYYYRRLFTDAANALEAVRQIEGVDPTRILTAGSSQGGALALAASALDKLRNNGAAPQVLGVIANVPFLSNFKRAIGLTAAYPYQEIVDYLAIKKDQEELVFNTLSYFDVCSFAKRGVENALFSVGLMDMVAPPSTVYSSLNWFAGEASINVYRYNGHEGGGVRQARSEVEWAKALCGSGE